jgi:C4-type Zn-finger protein
MSWLLSIPREMENTRRAVAAALNYFWGPCPMCGKNFAGYEVGKHRIPYIGEPDTSRMCCKWCDDHPEAEHIIAQGVRR